MLSLTLPILLLTIPFSVLACEGECIVGITHAWVGNYTTPLDSAFDSLAAQIAQELLHGDHINAQAALRPIRTTYDSGAYDGMRTAIFPSYFHGKCENADGVDPPGCPNPDCAVVCGTPGSLVHYFSTLRFIAYNYTTHALQRVAAPGGDAYAQAERAVVKAAAGDARRNFPYVRKREESVKKRFGEIVKDLGAQVEHACGGRAGEEADALPGCSWENAMRPFILSYP
ncbi:hypothetical protein BC834DRAFT_971902 [Gloeopeniophorella convolvens]|nr:hypothetical protein BC834DRAFT_971902 [Gloeopeniophorella convolvens]